MVRFEAEDEVCSATPGESPAIWRSLTSGRERDEGERGAAISGAEEPLVRRDHDDAVVGVGDTDVAEFRGVAEIDDRVPGRAGISRLGETDSRPGEGITKTEI